MDPYNTKEAILQLGIIDPVMKEIFKKNPPLDLSVLPYEVVRADSLMGEKATCERLSKHGTQETLKTIPMRDGYESEIRVIKPPDVQPSTPLVILIYGGGFIMGTNLQLVPWATATAALYGATVVLPSYRLAPEHKFPISHNDIWDTVKWLSTNASSLGADLSRGFIIGGSSAGANLSISTAHRAKRENLSPPITGVLASVPPCMTEETVPSKYKDLWLSHEQNALSPVCSAKDIEAWMKLFKPDYLSVDFSPLNSDVPLTGMPPTYVQVDGMDVLRDDGLIYERLLRDEGVPTRLDVYPGMPHGHWLWPEHPLSTTSQIDVLCAIGWLLGQEPAREEVERLWSTAP
ncbi:Alpha/Beta hydrolase protein [Penicillium bovifimosum]|uniref:Alpha/Beta hydrolase protein n=1 Tax=Penicillium bovifimosum TaxID=126998 RepID=A0A9W9GI51_9EURO|nr:Alpha/Beta hydrolase protein [Penicillium bovifimosum]KAJ5120918.1 Alpha/Beta hydrolase protein [Penicillium bovifimosum]